MSVSGSLQVKNPPSIVPSMVETATRPVGARMICVVLEAIIGMTEVTVVMAVAMDVTVATVLVTRLV